MPNFSGKWTLQAQMQAIAAGTWTGIPAFFSWGYNGYGQLGLNDTVNRSSPVQLGDGVVWSLGAVGGNFSAAIKTNGTLWSWGRNNSGQLGQNIAYTISRSSPVQVGALTDWSKISAGNNFCAAVKTTGSIWSWGRNEHGQLGQNDRVYRSSPVQIGALTDWSQVSLGQHHCAAIKTNNTLWTWGRNFVGQLGQNIAYDVSRSSPVQVGALTDWAQVSSGTYHCAAIKTNNTLWTWGNNGFGELGQNIAYTINRSSPVQVGALTDWAQVSAGTGFCIAIKTNGTLWSWGSNSGGRLGLGNTSSRSSPVQVGALTDWSKISAGTNFSAAIKTNNTLWTWGLNTSGQLGQNDRISRSSPVQVGSLNWSLIVQGPVSQLCLGIAS